ncbi:ABC transporter substrate-binding protein [Pararhizobium mangrovi]|uniref:Extracellular solute-binding protein n=1 Tax=Pararhizobium mangrovi TaxID=2590452 RepID=A0A506TYN0_9HYPH|nr:extracellular solute-binding protein [Pararhizobium mangrovi]TPW25825.1 extracellular solute-binding protein [Pararhizobium mangrovi]
MPTTTRRQALGLIGTGALAVSYIATGRARAATQITVLNWQGYGTDESWALKKFKEETGIDVVHDYFSSEPEMLTKLRTNPGAYDVVLINSARSQQASSQGLLIPIDFSKIPNSDGLTPKLKNHPNLTYDGKIYGCAWVWGMNALGIREGMTKPDSYAALYDPAYKNKVALFDDAVTEVGVGALLTGQDMNNPKDLGKVKDQLKKIKPNLHTIWSSEDRWNKAFVANEFDLSIYWSGAAVRSKRNFGLPVEFVVPKEGAIGWLDSLSIPKTSSNQDAAYKFINYMIDPDFYYTWATKVGSPASANQKAMEKLPEDDLMRQVHKQKYIETMSIMSALPNDRRETFNNAWQEIKAFYAG